MYETKLVRHKFHPVLQEALQLLKAEFVEHDNVLGLTGKCLNLFADGSYLPDHDIISVRTIFGDESRLDSTLMHELIHWTGHSTRCARPTVMRASQGIPPTHLERVAEEAVAEIGSGVLGEALGVKSMAAFNLQAFLYENPAANTPEAQAEAKRAVSFILEALAAAKKVVDQDGQVA